MMTLNKNTVILTTVLCLAALLFWSSLVGAQGRGANPGVCDGETGRAFGLCNAYCEAMDCDWDLNAPEKACSRVKSNYQKLTGEEELPCEQMSLACVTGDSGAVPPSPFNIGDGNDFGSRTLGITVPGQCECNGNDCTPCPMVVGYHGFGQDEDFWKDRLVPKGEAAGFISVYPKGDDTAPTSFFGGFTNNWAVPSCQVPDDGCLLADGIPCDWCGDITEDDEISTQREIDFSRAIIKWTMDNHCVDPGQIFGTGYSNGGLMSHLLARHPDTSGLFKALLPMDGVDQAGMEEKLKWIHAPQAGDMPWILHANEIFDRFEPYDGMDYSIFLGQGWNPVWIYPPVLQIFAEYAAENDAYSACGFGSSDVGDRFGVLDVGGVVPEGYRKLDGPGSLEGEGQQKFHCFTKDAEGETCEKLAICLWDSGPEGDDLLDPHGRAGREWSGGTDPGIGGTEPMDIMWRFFQWSVGNTD